MRLEFLNKGCGLSPSEKDSENGVHRTPQLKIMGLCPGEKDSGDKITVS